MKFHVIRAVSKEFFSLVLLSLILFILRIKCFVASFAELCVKIIMMKNIASIESGSTLLHFREQSIL